MHTADTVPASLDATAVTPLPLLALSRFRRLMQHEGCPVDVCRMCLDVDYAHQRLAEAHASASNVLRSLALELFATYDRNGAPASVH